MTSSNYKIYTGDMHDIVIEEGIEVLVGDELVTTGITESFDTDKVLCLRHNDIKDCQTITMPDSVKIIGPKTFTACNNLLDVEFSKNLEVIKIHAFSNCENYKIVGIPASVKLIESWAFSSGTIEEIFYSGSVLALDKIEMNGAFDNIQKIHCNDCEIDMTKTPHINELNFSGTVEEWNNSTEISDWIKATKKVICTNGVVEKQE